MRLRQFLQNSDSGVTLVELLVASAIASVLLGVAASTFVTQKKVVSYDLERTAVTQNLRSALDILGMNIRLAGENFSSTFPAVELTDGTSGAPDELTIRRNLFDEVLKVCFDLIAGNNTPLSFAIPGKTAGCIYSDQAQNFNTWSSHLSSEGGQALGYVYDPATLTGEFFSFNNAVNTGSEMYLQIPNNWANGYTVGQTAAYIMEQWQFRLSGENLQLIVDGDTANPQNITFGIEDFQVTITRSDNTVVNSFAISDDWTDIKSINVQMIAQEGNTLQDVDRTLEASFFPRNVLSN